MAHICIHLLVNQPKTFVICAFILLFSVFVISCLPFLYVFFYYYYYYCILYYILGTKTSQGELRICVNINIKINHSNLLFCKGKNGKIGEIRRDLEVVWSAVFDFSILLQAPQIVTPTHGHVCVSVCSHIIPDCGN